MNNLQEKQSLLKKKKKAVNTSLSDNNICTNYCVNQTLYYNYMEGQGRKNLGEI